MGLPPGDRAATAGPGLEHGVQLSHGEQDGPAGQRGGHLGQVGDRLEPLLDDEREELVGAAVGARTGDGTGRLDHQGRVQLAADQYEAAGDPEHGLVGRAGVLGAGEVGAAARDAAYGPLELLLGHLDDLRGDAGGVGEREHSGFVSDEQHGAGAFRVGVALGAAGGAVVAARGVLAGEQPVGFFVADLGAYVVADVEHARHGGLLGLGAGAGRFPARQGRQRASRGRSHANRRTESNRPARSTERAPGGWLERAGAPNDRRPVGPPQS